MPVYENRLVVEIAKGIRAFMNLQIGVSRGEAPKGEVPKGADYGRPAVPNSRVSSGNIVWIFGTARTGSTWLARMLNDLPDFSLWNEPLVGELFANMQGPRLEKARERKDFIFSESGDARPYEAIRRFVLDAAVRRFPEIKPASRVVVKEPHGSHGSTVLMNAFPESRMIFLIRDPRDVVASGVDAYREGGWGLRHKLQEEREAVSRQTELDRAGHRARLYLRDIGTVRQAYQSHAGRKTLIRYEDLRYNALEVLTRACEELELQVPDRDLREAVRKQDWENVPPDLKGAGKGKRKAKPGGWREDLTAEQVRIVEETCAPIIEEFYPETPAEDE